MSLSLSDLTASKVGEKLASLVYSCEFYMEENIPLIFDIKTLHFI